MSRADLTEGEPGTVRTKRFRPPKRAWVMLGVAVALLLVGIVGGPYIGKLSEVQKNDNAAYLPKSAESTKVDKESEGFSSVQTIPGFIVYQRASALTGADKAKIEADAAAFRNLPGVASDPVASPKFAAAGKTATVPVPLIGKRGNVSVNGNDLVDVEKKVISTARDGAPAGLAIQLLLVATVVLSFSATLGVSALVFNHVFHFKNADPAFPLFAFIFLVALGIDYNIFLMTRVREETLEFGTRNGILRGLSVTGGVITSAGVVLAATFAVLGVLPVVFLAEIGFAVAFGVLLDTILVRSILVPALSHDIGKRVWWPSRLAQGAD